jgi:hypothetical protein
MNPLLFTVASHLFCNMFGHPKKLSLFGLLSLSNYVFFGKRYSQPLTAGFL